MRRHLNWMDFAAEALRVSEMNRIDLQAQIHAPSCLTRATRAGEDGIDIGTTDPEFCTCGLAADLEMLTVNAHEHSRQHSDGPSVRPNWRRGKR